MKKTASQRIPSIDFDLRQLEIFRKVVELKSFSKAADQVFLAQASVSERIATLENLVGTRLLDRLGRQVAPTKAGELLYKQAVLLLDMKRAASLEMEQFLGLRQGKIHMGGSTIPGEYILPKYLGDFHEKYPSISVLLTIADTGEIERRVLDGNVELGVIGSKSGQRNLVHSKLWQDELVLAVPARHGWADKEEVSIKDLFDEPFIMRETGSGTLKIIENYLQSAGRHALDDLEVAARFGTSTAVKEGIKAGLGISILSSRALDTELKTGILKALRVKDLPMSRNFYLIRDRRRVVSPLCRAMIDFLLATCEKMPAIQEK
ncbi:MAG: LysR family transcriptional regulator [Deltaproteobacteria bacterium]|nr:LysR family transcriptional regulator [Deltaproteobacteria bacterium]